MTRSLYGCHSAVTGHRLLMMLAGWRREETMTVTGRRRHATSLKTIPITSSWRTGRDQHRLRRNVTAAGTFFQVENGRFSIIRRDFKEGLHTAFRHFSFAVIIWLPPYRFCVLQETERRRPYVKSRGITSVLILVPSRRPSSQDQDQRST